MELQSLLERKDFAVELAFKAGKVILEASGKMKKVNVKESFADLVTEVM